MGKLLTRRRFTVDEYHRMGETGILPEDSRIELICGDIVLREPIGAYHAGTVRRLDRLFTLGLGNRAIVSAQNPVQFPKEDTELQPDVALLRPRDDLYTSRHPQAADVLLLIEVADTTLRLDRRVKVPLYARAGVQEVWLLDLTTRRLEVYREPLGDRYRSVRILQRGQHVSPAAFGDFPIDVADLLP
jgi:Uma2 family endonuclease